MKRNSVSKIGIIIRHEYLSKVKTKGFVIATILGPIILLLFFGVTILVALISEDDTEKKIAVLDRTGKLGLQLVEMDTAKYFLSYKTEEELRSEVFSKELDGYLVIPEDILQRGDVRVFTTGGGGLGFLTSIERNLGAIVRHERLLEAGADESVIALVEKGINVETQKVTKKGTEKDYTAAYTFIGYILGFMIYMLMLMYGSFVSRGVIEEKANRIIEVIASSARPFQIMFGKVVGIGAVGLTQILIWIVAGAIILAAIGPVASLFITPEMGMPMDMPQGAGSPELADFDIPPIPPLLVLAFVFYFLSGYFIYATLFAAIGSAVDQEQDAAHLQTPVMVPIIIPIIFIPGIMANPDGALAVALSLFPFFTPILMIVRIAATSVPLWQLALSLILMVGTFFVALWIAAKIYRVGILMYGKKPSLKDLVKWVRLAK